MKKLIILFLLLFAGGVNAQNDPFVQTDTIVRTVQTYYADTTDLKFGNKAVYIHNTTGGILRVAFSNSNGVKDSINFTTVPNGNRVQFYQTTSRYMYLKSTVSGTALITVKYGYGVPYDIIPTDANGAWNVTGTVTATPTGTQTITGTVEKELVTVSFAFEDTTDNVIDSLSRLISDTANSLASYFTTAYKMTIYSVDTTVQFSPDITFPANQIYRAYSGGSWNSPERYDVSVYTNWFIRSPNTGIHTYYVVLEGY